MRRPWLPALLVLGSLLAGCVDPGPPGTGELPPFGEGGEGEITAVATNLDTVWEIAFSPDGRMFLDERRGRILTLAPGQGADPQLWTRLDVEEIAEAGLLGLALHPGFPEQAWVYACHTYTDDDGELRNRIVRVPEEDGQGGEPEIVLEGMDGNGIHDGCRLAFGPDGLLYATMGDAARASRAQDPSSLNGKTLRITEDGQVPQANPTGTPVFTLGHRNPQGLAFHPSTGQAYITEHGPDDFDEVNVLRAGENYGWPVAQGAETGDGQYQPAIWDTGPRRTVAPAGADFIDAPDSSLDGAFVFATLKAAQLHVLELDPEDPTQVTAEHVLFQGDFGRMRAVAWGPDQALYVSTSNEDGRGSPGPDDDRVLRIPLAVLEQAVRTASG